MDMNINRALADLEKDSGGERLVWVKKEKKIDKKGIQAGEARKTKQSPPPVVTGENTSAFAGYSPCILSSRFRFVTDEELKFCLEFRLHHGCLVTLNLPLLAVFKT